MEPWRRNLTFIWCTQILSMVGFGFVLPFLPFYIQELGVTDPGRLKAWTGAIAAAPGLLMGIMAPIWGALADRWGRRLMLLRATLAGCAIMAALALARSVEAVLILRTIQGAVAGTIAAAATLVAAGTPKDRLSFALGFLASATFIGYSMGPSLGGLCAEWLGYRPTFLIGAALLFLNFWLVLLFVKEVGAQPATREEEEDAVTFSPAAALRMPFLPVLLVFFILRFTRSLPFPFVPLYIQELRGTIQGAAALTGALAAATGVMSALSGLTLTRLGDRFDRLKLVGVFLTIGTLLALPIFFLQSPWGFVVLYVLAAFVLGPTTPLLEAHMSSMTSSRSRGVLFGVQAFVSSMGWFMAPIVGSAVTIALSNKHIFLFFALALALSIGVAAIAAHPRARRTVEAGRRLPGSS